LAVATTIVMVIAVVFGGRLLGPVRQPQPALAGTHLTALAYGLGAVWVVDSAGGQLVEMDPVKLTVRQRIPVGPDPVDVAVAGNEVWVLCRGDATLHRYDPEAGTAGQVAASLDSVALATAGPSLLVLSTGNQTLEVRDAADGHPLHAVVIGEGVRAFAADKDSAVLAAGSDLMAAALTDKRPHALATLPSDVRALALADDGTALVATAGGQLVVVTPDGQISSSVTLPGQPVALAIHDQTVWASTGDGSLIQLQLVRNILATVHMNRGSATVTDLVVMDDGSVVGIAAGPPFVVHLEEQS
jgi:hypothetical protein